MNDLVSDDFINSILDEIENLKSSQISMAEEGEYITFNLAGGMYGILLLKVKEVIKMMPTTGSGIDSNAREHLFEPFFTTKGKDKGNRYGVGTISFLTGSGTDDIQLHWFLLDLCLLLCLTASRAI